MDQHTDPTASTDPTDPTNPDPTDELRALNETIGVAESAADRTFFEAVLHPNFLMVRPSGLVATREEFLDGLRADARRITRDLDVTVFPTRRAVVRCTVVKWSGDGENPPPETPPADAPAYDNLRLFWRDDAGWRLVSWVNEPLT